MRAPLYFLLVRVLILEPKGITLSRRHRHARQKRRLSEYKRSLRGAPHAAASSVVAAVMTELAHPLCTPWARKVTLIPGVAVGQNIRYPVVKTVYGVHAKRNAPPGSSRVMRVEYYLDLNRGRGTRIQRLAVSDWICFEHTGYAWERAKLWWERRSNMSVPGSAEEAVRYAQLGMLADTKSITVYFERGKKYPRIVNYELGAVPSTLACLQMLRTAKPLEVDGP